MAVLLFTMLVLMVQCPAERVIGLQRNGDGMPRRRSMMIRGRRRRILTLTICCAVRCMILRRDGWVGLRGMRECFRQRAMWRSLRRPFWIGCWEGQVIFR